MANFEKNFADEGKIHRGLALTVVVIGMLVYPAHKLAIKIFNTDNKEAMDRIEKTSLKAENKDKISVDDKERLPLDDRVKRLVKEAGKKELDTSLLDKSTTKQVKI